MSNVKSPAWYGGGLAAFLLPGANLTDGALFYVQSANGVDAAGQSGLSPDNAFLTVTYALSRCTSGDNNYIIVLDHNTPGEEDTWPIDVDVDNVQIIAAQHGSHIPSINMVSDAAAVFDINAHDVRIQGFMVRPGGANPGITFSGSHGGMSVLGCRFDVGTYGLYSEMGGIGWGLLVERCSFVGNLTVGGIYLDDDPASIRIHDNVFKLTQDTGHIAIDIVNGGQPEITANQFQIDEEVAATGYAITLRAMVHEALVNNNWVASGVVVPAFNPYRDLHGVAAEVNNWGLNYMGLTPTYPVIV